MLAGGTSVDAVNIGNESTNTRYASCSRKVCSNCLMANPSLVLKSPIEVVERVADDVTWCRFSNKPIVAAIAPFHCGLAY